jgi:hypothetical protein
MYMVCASSLHGTNGGNQSKEVASSCSTAPEIQPTSLDLSLLNVHDTHYIAEAFRSPTRTWSRAEVLDRPSPVPKSAGIYGWYLRQLPPGVPDTRAKPTDVA